MYVCPRCKGPLVQYTCSNCHARFSLVEGIPCFLTESVDRTDQQLRQIYDDIYSHHVNVWVDQGRSQPFLRYFRDLAESSPNDTVLEIGCGEGTLLAVLDGATKVGIDPSIKALLRARQRSGAECAVARAEELPFPPACFDLVVAVAVMEHFEDPDAATAEIHRVLKPSGRYVALIQTDMTRRERLAVKVREYLYPRFRALALVRWLAKKVRHRIVQPHRKSYTVETARRYFERNGLMVTQIVTRATQPDAPLAGDHVVILLARRGSAGNTPPA